MNFKNQRATVFEIDQTWTTTLNHVKLIYGGSLITFYCMTRNIMKFRPVRAFLWMIPTLFLTLTYRQNTLFYQVAVRKIDLNEDGRHVDIYFLDGSEMLYQDISCFSTHNSE